MDRRGTLATIFGILLASGVSAMIGAAALPEASPYFAVLMYGGGAGLVVGFVGLLCLLIFQPKGKTMSGDDDEMGDDNTLYGNVNPRKMGSRNTIVGPTHGTNTIIPGGTSVGHGAGFDPTGVIIGSGAGAGLNRKKKDDDEGEG